METMDPVKSVTKSARPQKEQELRESLESLLLPILNENLVNGTEVAMALYPDEPKERATAKYHAKRSKVRYQKFSLEELQRLSDILCERIGNLYQKLTLLHAA